MFFLQRAERKPQRNSQYKNAYIEREWNRNCAFIKKHKTIHIIAKWNKIIKIGNKSNIFVVTNLYCPADMSDSDV